MAAAKCFFCKKLAQCDDHRADCNEIEGKPIKVHKGSNTIEVTFLSKQKGNEDF